MNRKRKPYKTYTKEFKLEVRNRVRPYILHARWNRKIGGRLQLLEIPV